MIVKLLRWLRGYLLVVVKGYSPERFLNLCSNRNILIWNLHKTNVGYEFNISLKGYLSLKPIARKTKTLPIIKTRIGLPFYLHKYRKRKMFCFGILLASILVYIMSLYIWDIEISGQYTHTEEAMIKFLNTTGVYAGILKGDIDCTEIEEIIRKEYSDIGWVSAEIKGTRLLIQITETNMPKPYVKQTEPSHIVADKDGIVIDIVTRTGTPKVKKGDVVKKGDILVSGVVEVLGDDQTVVKKERVIADADVLLKSYYTYKDSFTLEYEDKLYTKRQSKYYCLSVLGYDMYLLNPFKDYTYGNYDQVSSESNVKLNSNFYLPIKWKETENKEFTLVKKVYSQSEATAKAQLTLNQYLEKLQKAGVEIVENQVVISVGDSSCTSQGKLIVLEYARDTRLVKEEEAQLEQTPIPNERN